MLTGCNQSITSATQRTVDCSGKQTFNSPKVTLNLGVEHTFELGAYRVIAAVDSQYKSSRYVGFEYLAAERQSRHLAVQRPS